jgi:hypothetical protein
MRRRDAIFAALVASAFSSPLTAWAQLMRRVVLFTIHEEASPAGRAILDALRGALRELGWSEGRHHRTNMGGHEYGSIPGACVRPSPTSSRRDRFRVLGGLTSSASCRAECANRVYRGVQS